MQDTFLLIESFKIFFEKVLNVLKDVDGIAQHEYMKFRDVLARQASCPAAIFNYANKITLKNQSPQQRDTLLSTHSKPSFDAQTTQTAPRFQIPPIQSPNGLPEIKEETYYATQTQRATPQEVQQLKGFSDFEKSRLNDKQIESLNASKRRLLDQIRTCMNTFVQGSTTLQHVHSRSFQTSTLLISATDSQNPRNFPSHRAESSSIRKLSMYCRREEKPYKQQQQQQQQQEYQQNVKQFNEGSDFNNQNVSPFATTTLTQQNRKINYEPAVGQLEHQNNLVLPIKTQQNCLPKQSPPIHCFPSWLSSPKTQQDENSLINKKNNNNNGLLLLHPSNAILQNDIELLPPQAPKVHEKLKEEESRIYSDGKVISEILKAMHPTKMIIPTPSQIQPHSEATTAVNSNEFESAFNKDEKNTVSGTTLPQHQPICPPSQKAQACNAQEIESWNQNQINPARSSDQKESEQECLSRTREAGGKNLLDTEAINNFVKRILGGESARRNTIANQPTKDTLSIHPYQQVIPNNNHYNYNSPSQQSLIRCGDPNSRTQAKFLSHQNSPFKLHEFGVKFPLPYGNSTQNQITQQQINLSKPLRFGITSSCQKNSQQQFQQQQQNQQQQSETSIRSFSQQNSISRAIFPNRVPNFKLRTVNE